MIFITAKFQVKPEHADAWPEITREFTEACNAEPGCKWFQWSRSVADPNEYILVEAFDSDDAAAVHVNSDHFKTSIETFPQYLVATPKIINFTVDQDDWSELGEMRVD